MNTVTISMLQNKIDYLNQITDSPAKPYIYIDGKNNPQINNFHLYQAYGRNGLHRMVNESGGVTDRYIYGLYTKRDLYDQLCALIRGFELANELKGTK